MKTRMRNVMLNVFIINIFSLTLINSSALGDFEYSFVLKWGTGTYGSGDGEFNTAHFMDVDSLGYIYNTPQKLGA